MEQKRLSMVHIWSTDQIVRDGTEKDLVLLHWLRCEDHVWTDLAIFGHQKPSKPLA